MKREAIRIKIDASEEELAELRRLIKEHASDDVVLLSSNYDICDGCAKRCGGELEVIEGMKHDGATVLKVSQVTLEAIVEHACGLRVVIDDTMHDGQMVVE